MKPRGIWLIVAVAFALFAAACSDEAAAGGDGSATLEITTPADGAEVGSPFTVEVASNIALGDPSTGNHHVHLCFDDEDCDTEYALVYGSTFEVNDLTSGEHTIEASLRNADHSYAGVTDTTSVTVGSGTANVAVGDSPAPSTSEGTTGGFGY